MIIMYNTGNLFSSTAKKFHNLIAYYITVDIDFLIILLVIFNLLFIIYFSHALLRQVNIIKQISAIEY